LIALAVALHSKVSLPQIFIGPAPGMVNTIGFGSIGPSKKENFFLEFLLRLKYFLTIPTRTNA